MTSFESALGEWSGRLVMATRFFWPRIRLTSTEWLSASQRFNGDIHQAVTTVRHRHWCQFGLGKNFDDTGSHGARGLGSGQTAFKRIGCEYDLHGRFTVMILGE